MDQPITVELTNCFGQPWHPTDLYAFWRVSKEKREAIRAVFDRAVAAGADPKDLEELISWGVEQGVNDEAFAAAGEDA